MKFVVTSILQANLLMHRNLAVAESIMRSILRINRYAQGNLLDSALPLQIFSIQRTLPSYVRRRENRNYRPRDYLTITKLAAKSDNSDVYQL